MLNYRTFIFAVVALVIPFQAMAADHLTIESDGRRIDVQVFATNDDSARSGAVILLHGGRGLERDTYVYERYAKALAAIGIEALLVPYYSSADAEAMKSLEWNVRQNLYQMRLVAWTRTISDVIDILAKNHKSIGILGFSQGGYLATAVAATDTRVAALAVLYGGMPDAIRDKVTHLPELLVLHGDMDRVVPLSEGQSLIAQARALGAHAEIEIYQGKGHGFDFNITDPAASDAVTRAVSFFRSKLHPT